ncbi:hypothetical protein KAF25_001279 [Fusarium avenaceum]|uniref:Prolyl 4-hydroxylase alpha subunit Fe(2+) 2OG dioxygenase domain-containing protein n=1 Tax=Fusarium avenaceum TaxID=40199 RepID=A0A9P7KUV9_9HYPO|nr:hypothetical protein KAF25_001279 [Fusarium avenaceum]
MFGPPVVEISDDSSDDAVEDNEELLQVLDSIQSTGKIATFSRYPAFVNPGLTIQGNHLIPLPLKEDDAQAIKSVCRQAPFGHGDKTVVDTSVRNTWELDASKFELVNSQWLSFFDVLLRDTAEWLGFQVVVAKPHKLLLYEPGSFFKSHKDSEKEQGMIGTLVICSGAGFYLLLAHATHVQNGEDGYGTYYDDSEENHTTLSTMYGPNAGKVASDVDINVDEILGYSISKEEPDSEDEGEYTGNENAPPTFRYHKTVIVLVPKAQLRHYLNKHSSIYNEIPKAENECLAEMVCQDLANNRNDPSTKQVATAFMEDVLNSGVKPKAETIGLISKWALELDNIEMFRACVRATYTSVGARPNHINAFPFYVYRKAISKELVDHLRTHWDGKEQGIEWEYWLQDLKTARDIVTEFDAFCALFRTSTEHQPLLKSFNAWADPVCEEKLRTQSLWAKSDREYVLGTLKSRNADQLYKSIIQHGGQQLCLSETDLTPNAQEDKDEGYGYRTPCQKFVRMLDEGYINSIGQETLALLEQSCKILIERKNFWSSVSPQHLRRDFLEPLIKVLKTHNVPPIPAVQGFFEIALRDIFHKPINTRLVHLPGWAHQERHCSRSSNCGECRQMNDFLKSPEQQQWHYMAGKPSREHVEAQLRDPVYSFETLKHRSPHTLVVTKRGTNYDMALLAWKEAFRAVDDSVYWIRNDYLRGFMGEEKYKDLFLLEKPGQEDLRGSVTLSWPGRGDMAPPSAKRTRLW